ncbi:hypothetical protein [Oceanobacillus senegalensis]|uniref:hypothetical protein n=1 Tax=Oceanobacillus senegalensis TaxID=1936063 RepID=UPI000A304B88|nr:hypothetical protein [Oceanobacillus senegalensis]
MSVLVVNCNQWIGFHVVNELLDNQHEVDGVIDRNISDDLSMFFGRNSSFSFVSGKERKIYSTCIIIGHNKEIDVPHAERIFVINSDEETIHSLNENTVHIQALLFGEWMPMNQNGFYHDGKLLSFDSKEFKEDAIYIHDFTSALVQWVNSSKLPNEKEMKVNRNDIENGIYMNDKNFITKKKDNVLTHYERYKNFYPQN